MVEQRSPVEQLVAEWDHHGGWKPSVENMQVMVDGWKAEREHTRMLRLALEDAGNQVTLTELARIQRERAEAERALADRLASVLGTLPSRCLNERGMDAMALYMAARRTMTNVWDERHAPLSDVELGEVWSDFGYAQMTPRRFKDLAARMVVAVLAAQERAESEECARLVDAAANWKAPTADWKRTASSAREPVDPEVPF